MEKVAARDIVHVLIRALLIGFRAGHVISDCVIVLLFLLSLSNIKLYQTRSEFGISSVN